MKLICQTCKKEYEINNRPLSYLKKRKYCTRACYRSGAENDPTKFQKGHNPLIDQWGEKNASWKGDNVGYAGLHAWVKTVLGKPQKCDKCGCTDKKYYDWANISHQYKRDLNDWIRLCRSCHTKMDRKMPWGYYK